MTDSLDLFPLNSSEWADYDSDGIGDNADSDDDDDGVLDEEDAFPLDSSETSIRTPTGLATTRTRTMMEMGYKTYRMPFPWTPSDHRHRFRWGRQRGFGR